MDRDVEELVSAAREIARAIASLATRLLLAGGDPDRTHRRYFNAGFELWDEAEARAVLASAGDHEALERLEELVRELRLLRDELKADLADQESKRER